MINVVYNGENAKAAVRDRMAAAMKELMEKDQKVYYLDADLMSSIGMSKNAKEFPDRVIDCGIQEANMIGVACGLAASGKRPFAHSFGIFASRRVFDQIFLSAAYANNSIRVIGSDSGVCAEYNGGTHMPLEDITLMRAVPGSTIIDISDGEMMFDLIKQTAYREGFTYIRTPRKSCKALYAEGSQFEIGKGIVVKDGTDVTIIACGIMVAEALEASKLLEEKGISAAVIDMFTVKPLDEELVLEYAKKTGCIVTAENHSATAGLGGAVAELLAAKLPTPQEFVGVGQRFGEVGPMNYLKEQFGLTAKDIAEKAQKAVSRK